jgi:hypothetical protein
MINVATPMRLNQPIRSGLKFETKKAAAVLTEWSFEIKAKT